MPEKSKRRFGTRSMVATLVAIIVAGAGFNLYATFKPSLAKSFTEEQSASAENTIPADYKIHLLTENFPPFNMAMRKNNEFKSFSTEAGITGIGADVVRETMKRAGIRYEMTLRFPWSRIYKMAEDGKGFGLFVTTRTAEREQSFKWVGPVGDTSMVLIAKPGSTLKMNSLEDARGLKIGGYAGDSVAEFLKGDGFTVLESPTDINNIQKLLDGQIDVWATTDPVGPFFAKSMGVNDLPVALRFKTSQVYLALNIETPAIVVKELQKAFDSIESDGTLAAINKKYL